MAADDSGRNLAGSRSAGMDASRTTDLLEETLRATIAVGQQLSDEEWELPTDCPAWTVKDHVSHLIGTERMLQGLPLSEIEPEPSPT